MWQTVQVRRWVAIFGLAWWPRSISNTCEHVRSLAIAVRYRLSRTLWKYFTDSKLCLNIRYLLNIGLSSELSSFFQSFIKDSITLDLHWDLNEVKFPCGAIPYNFVNSVTLVTHELKTCRCKLSSSMKTDFTKDPICMFWSLYIKHISLILQYTLGHSRPHSPYTIVLHVVAFTCRTHLIKLRTNLVQGLHTGATSPPYVTAICCDRLYQWIKYVEHDRCQQNANSAHFSAYTKWRFPGLIAQVLVIFTEYVLLLRTNAFHNIAKIFIPRNLLDLFIVEI